MIIDKVHNDSIDMATDVLCTNLYFIMKNSVAWLLFAALELVRCIYTLYIVHRCATTFSRFLFYQLHNIEEVAGLEINHSKTKQQQKNFLQISLKFALFLRFLSMVFFQKLRISG